MYFDFDEDGGAEDADTLDEVADDVDDGSSNVDVVMRFGWIVVGMSITMTWSNRNRQRLMIIMCMVVAPMMRMTVTSSV